MMHQKRQTLERPTITSELYEKYYECCSDLHDLEAAFRKSCPKGATLHHQLFTAMQDDAPGDKDWSKLFENNSRPNDSEWEEWEIFSNRLYCSRYFGTGDKAIVTTFKTLATKGQSILARYLSLESTTSSELPELLQWSLPLFNRSTIDQLPQHYYFLYLIGKSGAQSNRALMSSRKQFAREREVNLKGVIGLRVSHQDHLCLHAADTITHWLPPAWDLDAVEPQSNNTPRWDHIQRELWFGDLLIKRYRTHPGAQEELLAEFQAEGWPQSIDDPLQVKKGVEPKRRLRDAVDALNDSHKTPGVIHFDKNGFSTAVTWGLGPRPKNTK